MRNDELNNTEIVADITVCNAPELCRILLTCYSYRVFKI